MADSSVYSIIMLHSIIFHIDITYKCNLYYIKHFVNMNYIVSLNEEWRRILPQNLHARTAEEIKNWLLSSCICSQQPCCCLQSHRSPCSHPASHGVKGSLQTSSWESKWNSQEEIQPLPWWAHLGISVSGGSEGK